MAANEYLTLGTKQLRWVIARSATLLPKSGTFGVLPHPFAAQKNGGPGFNRHPA
jgi:hypothetical protein